MGFEIEASHHEVAPGQHEIDFKYADAIKAADQIQTFKLVVKTDCQSAWPACYVYAEAAVRRERFGMHCHQSLFRGNENAFYDENDKLGLSQVARYYMAGVLRHARAFAAITNPTVNSYKRLVPGYEAPCTSHGPQATAAR